MSLDLLPNIHHILQKQLSIQVPLMLLSTAWRSSTHLSRRLPLLLFHVLPSIIMNLLKLLWMLVPLVSWFSVFKSQSLLLRESLPLLLVKLPSTPRSLPRPLSIRVPFHILLPLSPIQMPSLKDTFANALPKSLSIPLILLKLSLKLKFSQEF